MTKKTRKRARGPKRQAPLWRARETAPKTETRPRARPRHRLWWQPESPASGSVPHRSAEARGEESQHPEPATIKRAARWIAPAGGQRISRVAARRDRSAGPG